MTPLSKAIEIAVKAHDGQKDKAGKPYILHPLHVMMQMDTEEEQCVAVLHDVLEDTEVTYNELKETFEDMYPYYNVADSVNILSRKEGEKYYDFIKKIKKSGDRIALKVKLADIAHNSSEERLKCLDDDEAEYLRNKYKNALVILK